MADTTEMDFSTHKAVKGLAPIGNSQEDLGFSVHTVLAMNPQTQQLLGCITQEPFLRKLAPKGETKSQRKKREREEPRVGAQCETDRTGASKPPMDLCGR